MSWIWYHVNWVSTWGFLLGTREMTVKILVLGKDLLSCSEAISLWHLPLLKAALSYRPQTFEKKGRKRLLSAYWKMEARCSSSGFFLGGGHLSDRYHRHHLRILPQQQMLLCMYLSDVDTSEARARDAKIRVPCSAEIYYAAWRIGRSNHSNQQAPRISHLRLLSLLAFVVILASLIIPSPVAFSLDSWSFFLAKSSMWLKPELGLISLREKWLD